MQKNHYLQYFKKNLLFLLSLSIVIVIILVILNHLTDKKQNLLKDESQRYLSLYKQYNTLKQDRKSHTIALKIWQHILQQENNSMQGLHINKAKKILDEVAKKHHVWNLNVKILQPMLRMDHVKQQATTLEYSEIYLFCSSMLDTNIFAFLNDVMLLLPGYVQVYNMDIAADDLDADSSNDHQIVKANIVLIWQNIKFL